MGGLRSRRKGAQYERDLARQFAAAMPGAEIRRGIQSRTGGDAADVEAPIFHIEAKRQKKGNPRAALAQAIGDARQGKIPLAVIKDDRQPAFCVLRLDDFLGFVGEYWQAINQGGEASDPCPEAIPEN